MALKLKVLFLLINLSISFAVKKECEKVDRETLKCNFIPKDIPNGILSVTIEDFKERNEIFEVNSSNFQSENWRSVKSVELSYGEDETIPSVVLKSKCFHGLQSLKELHIHLMTGIKLDPDVFNGLERLSLLDVSRCVRLSLTELVPSLSGKKNLPHLENLVMSKINFYTEPKPIDTKFAPALRDKNITSIDLSYTKLTDINATAFSTYISTLQKLNLSYSTISHVTMDGNADVNQLEHFNVLDASHIRIYWLIPYLKVFNMTWYSSDFPDKWYYVFSPLSVNTSACIQDMGSIQIFNSTFKFDQPLQWRTQEVIIRQNSIKYLDFNMLCNTYALFTIKHLDAAENRLEFLHPSIPACMPNLEKFNLSKNWLYKMFQKHHPLIEQLFIPLYHLKVINLSANFLRSIPKDLFINNKHLQEIDLSHNELDQVTFSLQHLPYLKVLYLQSNMIKILNEMSINLISINATETKSGDIKTTVHLESNPLSCSQCEAKTFLKWLTSTKSMNIPTSDLTCITENGSKQKISQHALNLVQGICNRETIIISVSTSAGLTVLVTMVTVIIIYKHRRLASKNANREMFFNKLHEGEGHYEFVTFLSHSSDDKDFVDDYVAEKLNENLQLMTGLDRNLVCTGDMYLRPGFLILDETARCVERAAAFIAVVSDSYCASDYCHNEIDLAYRLNKPIILMMKGNVDENNMTPTMKILFKSTVRLLWTVENDKYILKTTWKNICTSVLDLIVQKENKK